MGLTSLNCSRIAKVRSTQICGMRRYRIIARNFCEYGEALPPIRRYRDMSLSLSLINWRASTGGNVSFAHLRERPVCAAHILNAPKPVAETRD